MTTAELEATPDSNASETTVASPPAVSPDIWAACTRVLGAVPAFVSPSSDGKILFMAEFACDQSEAIDALEEFTLRDRDGDTIVVDVDEDGENVALMIRHPYGSEPGRYMLVEMFECRIQSQAGYAQVTVLPACTAVEDATAMVQALAWQEPEAESGPEVDEVEPVEAIVTGADSMDAPRVEFARADRYAHREVMNVLIPCVLAALAIGMVLGACLANWLR